MKRTGEFIVCNICGIKKPLISFFPYVRKCIDCIDLIRCTTCKIVKTSSEFGSDKSKRGGISNRCRECNNSRKPKKDDKYYERQRKRDIKRRKTSVGKLRNFFKDCLKRKDIDKSDRSWIILGFTKEEFNTKFPVIEEGKDIDHMIPLSWFKEDTPINISCSLHNLQLLEASINSSKSNRYYNKPLDEDYYKTALTYISEEYIDKFP